jgi:hypothetical protein
MSISTTFPPAKAARRQRTGVIPPSGVQFGSAEPLFEPDTVLLAGVGFSVAWAICRPRHGEVADAATTWQIHFWRIPAAAAAQHNKIDVAIGPVALAPPVAAVEIADRKLLLVATAAGVVVRITIPTVFGSVTRRDQELVKIHHVARSMEGITVVAAGTNSVLYLAVVGTNGVVTVTVDEDDAIIEARQRVGDGRGSGRASGWLPTLVGSLFGGRGKKENASESTAQQGDRIVRLFSASGHCFAETDSAVHFLSASEPTSSWVWSKEASKNSRPTASVVNVAVSEKEVWLLVRPVEATEAAIVVVSRQDADVCIAAVDLSLPLVSGVASARSTRNRGAFVASLHVADDVNCSVVGRTQTHYCCVADTVRTPRTEIVEGHPMGVLALAAASNGNERVDVVTNHGILSLRLTPPQPGAADMSVNMSVNAHEVSVEAGFDMVGSPRGGAVGGSGYNSASWSSVSSALVQSPRAPRDAMNASHLNASSGRRVARPRTTADLHVGRGGGGGGQHGPRPGVVPRQ